MEEEHRQLPSTAGSSVNMEALLTALLETAEIKPFCSPYSRKKVIYQKAKKKKKYTFWLCVLKAMSDSEA